MFGWLLNLFRRKDAATWAADARDLLAKGKAARALSPAEKAVGMAPDDVDMLLLRSEVLRAADMPERALEDLLEALEKEPGRAAANLAVLEKLEPSAPRPELVWLQAWKVHAEKEALDRASELVRKIAGRGDAAVSALREQCKGMLAGGGDRRGALVALAVLAVERGETKDAVARVLELKAAGGRPALFISEGLLRGILNKGKDAPGALRALVAVRVLLGKEAEAREAALELCRRDPAAGTVLVEQLLEDEKKVAAFAIGLVAILEAEGKTTTGISLRFAEALLKEGRTADAAAVLLRTVGAEPSAAERILPLATKVLKAGGGLDAQDAHARAAALAGDHVSAILTAQEFVDTEPKRALDVLALLPPAARDRDDGALLGARAKAALGDHDRAAPDLRRWSLGGGGGRAKEALPSVAAVARAHADVPAYALLQHDLLQFTGDVEGAAKVLLDLVGRSPAQAEAVEARAVSLLKQAPGSYAAGLAAARAGLVRATDPGTVLGRLRAALESSPGREAEVLECLEGARKWTGGIEPVELFHGEMVLRTGNVDRGLAMLEEVVVRNAGRGPEALAVLRAFQQGAGAQDPRVFLSEHRIRRALKDWEACIVPLRKVADLDESRREEVLAAADAVIAEAPACRGAHRIGVEIAVRLEQGEEKVLGRLAALLDIPAPPRDTEYVTRRAGAVQAKKPTVAGHRLLVRCHLYASRWPLVLEEVRRLVEADAGTRGEAVGFLGHVLSHAPGDLPARFLLASLHSSLGAVDAAREVLAGALPRTEEVFDAHRRLIQAYPTHPGVRLDLVDALVAERRIDEALEEAAPVHGLPGAPAGEVVRRVEKILELSPEYAPALYALADAHHAASEWAPEIAACRRILRIAPREAETVLQRLDAVLDRDPRCGEAALEIVRIAPLHQRMERVAPEGRRALECASNPAEVAAVADALRAHERALGSDAAYREVLAQALTRAGRTKLAVAAWSRLLEGAPDRAPGSIRDLERLCAVEGKDGGEALRILALARLLAGDPAEAAEAVDRLLAREPDAVEDGRALFRRILAAHPSSHDAAAGVAKTSVQAGDADGAVEAWLHDLRQHPDRRREIGMALGGLREKFPGAASVPLALAEFIHLPLGLLEETAGALTAALAVDPSCHAKALLLAEQVLAREGKSPAGTAARARALTAAARYDDAVAGFRALAELDPRHREDALAGFDSVLEGGPGHPEAQYRRSEILLELGRAKESAEQATALLEALAPKDPRGLRALLLLACAREALEDFDGGLEALRRARAEHPEEPSVPPRVRANFAARLAARAAEAGKHGGAAGKPGVLDAAEAILDGGDPATALTAVGPEPEKGEALARWRTIRGRAFFVLGKPAEAVVELEEALKAKGMEEAKTEASRDALYFCGLSQLRVGEVLKAIRRLEQAARVAPEHRRVREAVDRVYEDDRRRLERPLSFTQDLETLRKGTAGA
jgi:tetratricopeptide (TPR) repeat protein